MFHQIILIQKNIVCKFLLIEYSVHKSWLGKSEECFFTIKVKFVSVIILQTNCFISQYKFIFTLVIFCFWLLIDFKTRMAYLKQK